MSDAAMSCFPVHEPEAHFGVGEKCIGSKTGSWEIHYMAVKHDMGCAPVLIWAIALTLIAGFLWAYFTRDKRIHIRRRPQFWCERNMRASNHK